MIGNDALLSPDGRYRYRLTRRWDDGPTAVWIMLNPSTADASDDDPTIRRCITFSQREGCGSLIVVNLCAYRATDPKALMQAGREGIDIQGPGNADHLQAALSEGSFTVAAWGAHAAHRAIAPHTPARIVVHRPMQCLGRTQAGHPRHPLYVRGDQPLEVFR